MHRLLFLFLIFFSTFLPFGFSQGANRQLKVIFYNTENLYDTIDDKHRNDNEFLPASDKRWTSDRYFHKLSHIGKVLCAIDSIDLPAVIGLAEVENRQVLDDLVRLTPLSGAPYEVLLEEGNDPRGIDVALLFRPDQLQYLSHRMVPASREFRTRDILYVNFLGPAGDTLHLFINHWKSRAGGVRETRPKRIENAALLREVVDSLFSLPSVPRILIMGDLNDEPCDESVALTLEALPLNAKPADRELYNLFYSRWKEGKGTLWYRDWDLFDQIIVSGNLLTGKEKEGPAILSPYGYIFCRPWMLDPERKGTGIPWRTYKGDYRGGFSDHLPVYVVLEY